MLASVSSLLTAISHVLWPLLALAAVVVLAPRLEKIIREREVEVSAAGIKVKVGGPVQESNVQATIEEFGQSIADLQQRVTTLTGQLEQANVEETEPVRNAASTERRIESIRSVLWVDDRPENNAQLIRTINRLGARTTEARSTDEALAHLNRETVDLIITDMGRGGDPEAGVDLIRKVRQRRILTPIIVYASYLAIERLGETARREGAVVATASPTEVLGYIQLHPSKRFELDVDGILRREGFDVVSAAGGSGIDFLVDLEGRRIGIEAKHWPESPPRDKVDKAFEKLERARTALKLDRVFLVTPTKVKLEAAPRDVAVVPVDSLAAQLRATGAA